jgi:hypothetical protein
VGGDVVFQKPQIDFCNGLREALQKGCISARSVKAGHSSQIATLSQRHNPAQSSLRRVTVALGRQQLLANRRVSRLEPVHTKEPRVTSGF